MSIRVPLIPHLKLFFLKLLHRCIASYTKIVAKARDQGVASNECVPIVKVNGHGNMSAAAYALGCCIAQLPGIGAGTGAGDSNADCNGTSSEVVASIKTVLTYAFPKERAGDAIVAATFIRANELSLDATENVFDNIHSECIRGAAGHLVKSVTDAKHLTDALVLSHFGTAWMSSAGADAGVSMSAQEEEEEEDAREKLEHVCSEMISGIQIDVSASDIADRIIQSAACAYTCAKDGIVISKAVHVSALSLVTSLGKIAGITIPNPSKR